MTELAEALAGSHRSDPHKARDGARNPQGLFSFFGVQPDMTVVDIWPTKGWSTEILAPLLKDQGQLYAAHFLPDHPDDLCRTQRAEFEAKLAGNPNLYGSVAVTTFGKGEYDIAPPGTADLVITLRNFHNWMWGDYLEPALRSFYRALKPGGVLGLEEHRGDPSVPQDPMAKMLYVREDYVIAACEKAGFKLDQKSEIGANPLDTKDHPKGALSLPPNFWGVDDRTPFEAIGESDRMTLRFVKAN